jgi:hypothetical protein
VAGQQAAAGHEVLAGPALQIASGRQEGAEQIDR